MILRYSNNKNMSKAIDKSFTQGPINTYGNTCFNSSEGYHFYVKLISTHLEDNLYYVESEHSLYTFELLPEEIKSKYPTKDKCYLFDTNDLKLRNQKAKIGRSLFTNRIIFTGEVFELEEANKFLLIKKNNEIKSIIPFSNKETASDMISYTNENMQYVFMPI